MQFYSSFKETGNGGAGSISWKRIGGIPYPCGNGMAVVENISKTADFAQPNSLAVVFERDEIQGINRILKPFFSLPDSSAMKKFIGLITDDLVKNQPHCQVSVQNFKLDNGTIAVAEDASSHIGLMISWPQTA